MLDERALGLAAAAAALLLRAPLLAVVAAAAATDRARPHAVGRLQSARGRSPLAGGAQRRPSRPRQGSVGAGARVLRRGARRGRRRREALEGLGLGDVVARRRRRAASTCASAPTARYRERGDAARRGARRASLARRRPPRVPRRARGRQRLARGGRSALLDELRARSPEHGWLAGLRGPRGDPAPTTPRRGAAARRRGAASSAGASASVEPRDVRARAARAARSSPRARSPRGCAGSTRPRRRRSAGEYEDLRAGGLDLLLPDRTPARRVRDFERAAQWCREVDGLQPPLAHRLRQRRLPRRHYGAVLVLARRAGRRPSGSCVAALESLTATRPFVARRGAVVRLAELRRRQGRLDEAARAVRRGRAAPARAARAASELALDRRRRRDWRASGARAAPARLPPADAAAARRRRVELARPARGRWSGDVGRGGGARRGAAARSPTRSAPTPLLGAASFAAGVVAAATGDHEDARDRFDDVAELFATAGTPLEAARARLGLAEALRALGRSEAAEHEGPRRRSRSSRGSARPRRAGARGAGFSFLPPGPPLSPARARGAAARGRGAQRPRHRRRGSSLSEHTVHRHVANIHAKLRCSSRAAAVALAHRLELL